jgi:hypothetical protein
MKLEFLLWERHLAAMLSWLEPAPPTTRFMTAMTAARAMPYFQKKIVSQQETIRSSLPEPHAISFPYAGIIQIRFYGYDLRLRAKPPRVRRLYVRILKGAGQGCQEL